MLCLAVISVGDQCAQTREVFLAECAFLVDLDVYLTLVSLWYT